MAANDFRCDPYDRELVAAMLRADERALRTFFDAYYPRIYRFALRRLGGDGDLAQDVVQATMIKAIRNLSSYRAEAALFSWLCQICRREMFDLNRTRRRRAKHVVMLSDNAQVRSASARVPAPVEQDPQQVCDAAEVAGLIRSVLAALPGRYGDVLKWRYLHGRSAREIGALLGTGQTAALSMLARAKASFRISLRPALGSAASDVLAGANREQ
ncbi:MAG: RNA polymerase sigma factor [Pseudomonadota bacterium]